MNSTETLTSSTMLSRREFLKLSGAGLAGATLLGTVSGCGASGGSGGRSAAKGLVFTSYGGSFQRAQANAWLKPYSKQSATTIGQDSPTDYEKIQSMVENNQVVWDVVDVGNDFGLHSTADLLEPLDYSVIDKGPILEGYASEYRIACMLYANVLAYNTEQVKGPHRAGPTSSTPRSSLGRVPCTRSLRRPWRWRC